MWDWSELVRRKSSCREIREGSIAIIGAVVGVERIRQRFLSQESDGDKSASERDYAANLPKSHR